MEVTTVSPSPASPTEWDDFCETDVTNVSIHSVTLLICLCGLVGNGAVLCLLRLLRLTGHNGGICGLAFMDILLLLFTVPIALLFLVEDVSCSPIVPLPYLSLFFLLSVFSRYLALLGLIFRSNTVYLRKLCLLCCHRDVPKCLLCLVDSVQICAFFALFIVSFPLTILCPSHQEEHCQAAVISTHAITLLLLAAPILIFITIDFIKAKRDSKKQKSKRRDVVIFLIVLFILLLGLCNFLWQLGYTIVSSDVFFLLNCIHSSIKAFIYFLAGRCWRPCSLGSLRLSLQRVFDEQEEEAAHSNDAPMDTESDPGDAFHCSTE